MSASARILVLSKYRELLRLVSRLAPGKREEALIEARSKVRLQKHVTNPEEQLQHLKELTSRIGFLRIITPKQQGDVRSGVFVVRHGDLVNQPGEVKGKRVADGAISKEEAVRRNERDFKRLYGAPKPKDILF